MSKFYCNKCEEEVELQDGKCPKCKTNWDKIINEDISGDSKPIDIYRQNEDNYREEVQEYSFEDVTNITEECINKNINFFLKWGIIGKVFMIFTGIIGTIISLCLMATTSGTSLLFLLVFIPLICWGIIFDNNLKWKAYMLYTNNKKKKIK